MGPNGEMIIEKYFDKNHVGKGADGKTVRPHPIILDK